MAAPCASAPEPHRLELDAWLHERPASPGVSDRLRCVWRGDLARLTTPLPDECLDLVWIDDGTMWVSGPESATWHNDGSRSGTTVGVRFHPGVGPALLRTEASSLRDDRVRLDAIWGDRAVRRLAARLDGLPDDRARARQLEAVVARLRSAPVDEVALEVARRLAGAATAPTRAPTVAELARTIGVSERQLRRRCTAAFGYGPATLARIARLHRFLQLARHDRGPRRHADLAACAGFSDEAHLGHEVRALLGRTPGEARRPEMSDRYKPTRGPTRDDGGC